VSVGHHVTIDPLLRAAGPGTFVTDFAGALQTDGDAAPFTALASCGTRAADDVGALLRAEPVRPADATSQRVGGVSLRRDVTLEPGQWTRVRARRGLIVAADATSLPGELSAAAALDTDTVLRDGIARLEPMPALTALPRDQQLVYRSAFALLDELMMPAEGHLAHDYYLFSREPTWWFSSLGQHAHESMSMILMSRLHAADAVGSQRIFFENIEPDGYLPYNIGPLVTQSINHTASAPMVSLVAWEIYRHAHDDAFLADAYDAGTRLHGFWVEQRDQDHDGLSEWGGSAISESIRDLHNVIWMEVAQPETLEAIDLNCWLVMEERSLANMARALGRAADAQHWEDVATQRAALINAAMWDDVTGFYYHVTRDGNSFTASHPNDLKRMEIAGLMPLWAGIVPADRQARLLAHMLSPDEFWRADGIPGLSASDPSYDPRASTCCRWNGPVWVQWQLLMARALASAGDVSHAHELTQRVVTAVTSQLRRVHQFRELYDADDPSLPNQSMPNYIWSSLVAEMMIEDAASWM